MSDGTKSIATGQLVDPFAPSHNNGGQQKSSSGGVGSSIYDLDYYSPTQAQIYIGDVLIDELTSISYSYQQNKQPVYGYASQMFDAVSKGNLIVQGQFSINFKESGYMWLILHRWKELQDVTEKTISKYVFKDNNPIAAAKNKVKGASQAILGGVNIPFVRLRDKGKDTDFISRAGIERLIKGSATKDERFAFYENLAGYATTSNPNAFDKAFEDIVEKFEDEVWQEDVTDLDNYTRRVDDNFFDGSGVNKSLGRGSFDIFLVFGDYTKPGVNHTVRRLREVHLLGGEQVIQLGDGTIQENYKFFCRTVL